MVGTTDGAGAHPPIHNQNYDMSTCQLLRRHFALIRPAEDPSGLPETYHAYLIIASDWQPAGAGIASVVALTSGTPEPNPVHVHVPHGDAEAALAKAEQIVVDLPGNQGLRRYPAR